MCPSVLQECVSESMLRAAAAGLQDAVCRLQQQLNVLDARVQALEENTSGIICIERSVWQELENRVLLIETGLALTRAQVPTRHPNQSHDLSMISLQRLKASSWLEVTDTWR